MIRWAGLLGTPPLASSTTMLTHQYGTHTHTSCPSSPPSPEYTVVHEVSVAKIPKEAPLDKVCLLGCGEWACRLGGERGGAGKQQRTQRPRLAGRPADAAHGV